MKFSVTYSDKAVKQLDKLDATVRILILKWVNKNLEGCENPRLHGKPLKGVHDGEWRYRVGDYRLLAYIFDSTVNIEVFKIGHRREVYD